VSNDTKISRDVPTGGYRFLPGIAPFSSGVVAAAGHQIVHATLRTPVPWREGFGLVERHLGELNRPRSALCAIELRSPAPFSFDGFDEFNAGYQALLAPVVSPPPAPVLYAFSYTVPGAASRPTFVVAGAGEMRSRGVGVQGIVRHGETSPEAMREKASHVMGIMTARLRGLDAGWLDVTIIDVYTAQPIEPFLLDAVLRPAGAAAVHGVRWFPSRPPIAGLEYEMDLRGVARELSL